MLKRLLLIVPLTLALAACGSSGNQNAPTTTPTAPTATRPAATTSAATPATPPSTAAIAAAAATTASAASASTPAAGTTASANAAPSTGMSAAAKAAMTKAAQDFTDNGTWVAGKNYFIIEPQQPRVTNSPKVEVVEVFSWGCPACNAAHKMIDTMRSQLPPYATMAYLAAGFRPDENWTLYQRAWYTAEALGIAQKSYDAMFDSNWKTGETGSYNLATGRLNPRSKWPDIQTIATFFHTKYGVAPKQFVAIANSFAINTQMKRADELIKDYQVPATPTIVIDGRYRFTFQSAGSYTKGIALAKWLVAKEAKRLTDASAGSQ